MFNLFGVLSLFGLAVSGSYENWVNEFDYWQQLDSDGKVKIFWTNINDYQVEIGMAYQTLGWCGLGVSPNGQMPFSDIALGWVDTNGNVYMQDRYVEAVRAQPKLDSNQNIELLAGGQFNGWSYFRFIRSQSPCDSNVTNQDRNIIQGTTKLIYAWNDNNIDINDVDGTFLQHTHKGSASVNLKSGTSFNTDLESDVQYYDVAVSDVTVPTADTTYWSTYFQLPATSTMQHIVRFEPVITTGNEATVHHMVFYKCLQSEIDAGLGDKQTCLGGCSCHVPIYAWAIGGTAFSFPAEAGLELSTRANEGLYWIRLEIHYDNPTLESGRKDSSGIRMYYTPTLRANTAGMIEIALPVSTNQFIVPGVADTQNNVYCPRNCTEDSIPSTGVSVFATFLHTHVLGRQIVFRHIRNNVELPIIDANYAYDFNYQQSTPLSQYITLLPGDEFILECFYDSTGQTGIVYGGTSTSEEMCQVYMYVFPKPQLALCISVLPDTVISDWITAAKAANYLTGTNPNFVWHPTVTGADDFYNELWTNPAYASRHYACWNEQFETVLAGGATFMTADYITGFTEYTAAYNCSDTTGVGTVPRETPSPAATTTTTAQPTESTTTGNGYMPSIYSMCFAIFLLQILFL